MTEDEGRFGRIDRPRRCWAPKPIRPQVPRQMVREFVYVFAAVCAKLGRLTALTQLSQLGLFKKHKLLI